MILDNNLSTEEKVKKLVNELGRLKKERASFEAAWDDAQYFVSSFQFNLNPGENDDTSAYTLPERVTGVPSKYLDILVTGLCAYGANPYHPSWMKLGLLDDKLAAQYGVRDWLDEVHAAMTQEYNGSNFYTAVKEWVESAATFGHGVMLIDEDIIAQRTRYKTYSVASLYLDVNEYGEYETVFRVFYETVENAVSRFGLENMAEQVREQWNNETENGQAKDKKIQILHAVFRRKNGKGKSERNTEFPFASYYVDTEHKHIIQESGYKTFPYAIFAWDRIADKKYSLSPALKALQDVALLNKMQEAVLAMGQKAYNPPLNIPETMRGHEDFGPGGYNYFDTGDQLAQPVQIGENFPITLQVTQAQQTEIKDWFYVNFFLSLMQQQGASINNMTATAVQALQGEKSAVMTHMIENLEKGLRVCVQRTFDIMTGQGRMPELPAALLATKTKMQFTFNGVIAQIQQAALHYSGFPQFINAAIAVANIAPAVPQAAQAVKRYDFDKLLQNEARNAGIAESVILDDDDYNTLLQQEAEAQAAQMQAAQQAQAQELLAKNFNKLNEPVKQNSPAAALAASQESGGGA